MRALFHVCMLLGGFALAIILGIRSGMIQRPRRVRKMWIVWTHKSRRH